mgnify:FL=1
MALDHDLTIIGASDIHGLIDYDYDISKGTHRTVTLVFAEERSVKGIAQALFQKHTVALYDRQFIGRDAELGALFNSFVSFERLPSRRKDRQQTTVRISNTGPIAIELKVAGNVSLNKSVGYITVPAAGSAIITVLDRAANDPIDLELVWVNSWKAPKTHASVQISL